MSTIDKSSNTDQGAQSFAYNCSSIIIGKNASTTGKVILAHNEDDHHVVMQQFIVPRMKHTQGEMLIFDDGKSCNSAGERNVWLLLVGNALFHATGSFADSFINEWGVAVVSDSCNPSKVSDSDPQHGDMIYACAGWLLNGPGRRGKAWSLPSASLKSTGITAPAPTRYVIKTKAGYCRCPKESTTRQKGCRTTRCSQYIPNWYTILKN